MAGTGESVILYIIRLCHLDSRHHDNFFGYYPNAYKFLLLLRYSFVECCNLLATEC